MIRRRSKRYLGIFADQLRFHHDIFHIPPQAERDTHCVKLSFEDSKVVKHILGKAKLLKNFEAAKIYINYDEPYHSRKENNRLRKKKSDLSKTFKDDVIKIEKGKLYHNNMIVDQFDLSNQLF